MWLLILGILIFVCVHVIVALPRKRNRLIKKFGETNYRIGFSIGAITGVLTIIFGYAMAREGAPIIYEPPFELRHLAMLLVLISFICLVAARMKGHIRWWLRHPQILAIKIWAFAHLLVNGDLASVILFGSFLGWAIFHRISLKKREQFGLVRSRDFEPQIKFDVITLVISGALYFAFLYYLHQWLIGVPLV